MTTKKTPAKKADDTPQAEPAANPKEQRAELNRQFEEADEKARAAIIDETQVGLAVRGY